MKPAHPSKITRRTRLHNLLLAHCRRQQPPWSLRELGRRADISYRNLYSILTAVFPCGPVPTMKLCSALKLNAAEQAEFWRVASSTTKQGMAWFPSVLSDMVTNTLAGCGLDVKGAKPVHDDHIEPTTFAVRNQSGEIVAIEAKGFTGRTPADIGRKLMVTKSTPSGNQSRVYLCVCYIPKRKPAATTSR